MKQIALIFILFSMMNCKPKVKEEKAINNSEKLKKVWMLIKFSSFEKKFLMDSGAQIDLTNSERATSKMGCNSFSYKYKVSNSEIVFTNGIATRMYCEEMKLENEFSKKIEEFKKYKIDGHKLTLYNSKNEKMVFVAQDWD